jgi:hypothetical protein
MRHLREQNLGINEIMGANWDPNSLMRPNSSSNVASGLSPPYSFGLGVEAMYSTYSTVQCRPSGGIKVPLGGSVLIVRGGFI